MTGPDDYEVGYGRPPKASQFQPGRSGNIKGRPRKSPEPQIDPANVIDRPVPVREGGSKRMIQPKEITLRQLIKKAQNGDLKAILRLIEEMDRYGVLMQAPARVSGGGVVTVPTDRLPFEVTRIMAQRFGARKAYSAKQLSIGQAEYRQARTGQQGSIDALIGYPDLEVDAS